MVADETQVERSPVPSPIEPSSASSRASAGVFVSAAVALVILACDAESIRSALHIGRIKGRAGAGVLALALLGALARVLLAGRNRFGTARRDRLVAGAALTIGFAIAVLALAREVLSTSGTANSILLRAALLLVEVLAGSLAASALLEPEGRGVRTAKLLLRLAFSLLLVTGIFALLEALSAAHLPSNLYAVESLDGQPASLHEDDPEVIWRMKPNFKCRMAHPEFPGVLIETNSLGLRDREILAKGDGHLQRPVIVLGDSFGLGLGVAEEDCIGRRLERMGLAPSVLNASVSGFGTFDELVFLGRLLERVEPSRILVLLYVGNELEDNIGFLRRHEAAGRREFLASFFSGAGDLVRELPAPSIGRVSVRFGGKGLYAGFRTYSEKRSSLARVFFGAMDRLSFRAGWAKPEPLWGAFLVRACSRAPDPEAEYAVRATVEALRAIAARGRAVGAETLVCLVPTKDQVEKGGLAAAFQRVGLDPARFDPERLAGRLGDGCAGAGVSVLDLLPGLRARREQGERLYFLEGHWTSLGHTVAAEAIAERLLGSRPAAPREAGQGCGSR